MVDIVDIMEKEGGDMEPLDDLKQLTTSELQKRFQTMYGDCADMECQRTVNNLLHELQVQQIELEMQNRQLQEAQQELEEARDRYADLYDFAPVCYVTFDAKGCIQEINLTGAALLNQERGRLIGRPFSNWLPVAELEKFYNHIQLVQQGYDVAIEELQLKLPKQRYLDVRIESVSSSRLINKQPTCRSVIVNISDRKQAERDLHAQTRQLQLITDAMPALIAYVDRDERYQFVNKLYEQWFQLPRDWIVGSTVKEIIGHDAYRMMEQFSQCALVGKPVTFELKVPYLQQGKRDIHASYIPDLGVDGKVAGYFVMIRDETEIKKHEEEYKRRLLETAHVARVNTMGEMVTEIAHELNQPLAAISIYSDTVSRMLRSGKGNQENMITALDEIKLQTERASQVIRRLRAFVSKKELRPVQTDINTLVDEVSHLLSVEARWNHVVLQHELSSTNPTVYVDKILIEQVILNLGRNAIEAMGAIQQEKRHLLIKTSQGTHKEIELCVEDSGPGLAMNEIDQIFEPFQSSKPDGVGMGLAICRSIVKAHHGRLWAIPNEAGGTTFTFTLPEMSHASELFEEERL